MEYITESLATSFQTSDGYCEVFSNPSTKELVIAANSLPKYDNPYEISNFSSRRGATDSLVTVAGAMTKDTLYVWNRDIAMHMTAVRQIAKSEKITANSMVPLYIDFRKTQPQTLALRYAEYSGGMLYHKNMSDAKVMVAAEQHPAFQSFTLVDIL